MVLFIPFLLYLGLFIVYSNVFNGQLLPYEDDDKKFKAEVSIKAISICLYAFSALAMCNEFYQLKRAGFTDYFASVWNWLDVSIPILVSIIVSYHRC